MTQHIKIGVIGGSGLGDALGGEQGQTVHPETPFGKTSSPIVQTQWQGVDICIDSIGRAVHLSCIKSLGRGGRFVTCGCTSGPSAETDLARIFWNQLSILGSTMGDMSEFHAVVDLFLQGRLRPVVDQVVAPAGIREAYAALEAGSQFGKLVVDWRT